MPSKSNAPCISPPTSDKAWEADQQSGDGLIAVENALDEMEKLEQIIGVTLKDKQPDTEPLEPATFAETRQNERMDHVKGLTYWQTVKKKLEIIQEYIKKCRAEATDSGNESTDLVHDKKTAIEEESDDQQPTDTYEGGTSARSNIDHALLSPADDEDEIVERFERRGRRAS